MANIHCKLSNKIDSKPCQNIFFHFSITPALLQLRQVPEDQSPHL